MLLYLDEAFKKVIKVKGGHKGEALTLQDWCPFKRRGPRGAHTQKIM